MVQADKGLAGGRHRFVDEIVSGDDLPMVISRGNRTPQGHGLLLVLLRRPNKMAGISGIGHSQLGLSAGNRMHLQNDINTILLAPAEQPIQQFPSTVALEKTMVKRNPHAIEPRLSDLLDVGFSNKIVLNSACEELGFLNAGRLLQPRPDGGFRGEDALAENPALPDKPTAEVHAPQFYFVAIPIDNLRTLLMEHGIGAMGNLSQSRWPAGPDGQNYRQADDHTGRMLIWLHLRGSSAEQYQA